MATLEEMQAQLAELESLQNEYASLQQQGAADSHFGKTMDFLNPQDPSYGAIGAPTQEQQAQSAVDVLSSPEGAGSPERRDMLLKQYHDYTDPIHAANSASVAKGLGRGALNVAGGVAATAMLPEIATAGLVARGAGYAMNGIAGALGAEAGDQVAQQTGLAPKKSFDETVDSIATNTALGGGIPLAADAGASALKSAASWFSKTLFNTPGRVAKFLGASSVDQNPQAEKYVTGKVEELMSNSPFFNEQILKRSNPGKQYDAATTYQRQLGQQIGSFYETHAPLPVPTQTILSHPKIVELQRILKDPYTLPDIRTEAEAALKGIEIVTTRPAHDLSDIWGLRQQLDNSIEGALYNAGPKQTPKYAEFVKDTADAVREAMEISIKQGVQTGSVTADAAEALLKAKQEYSNLSPIVKLLGSAKGKASGQTVLDKVGLPGLGALGIGSVNPALGVLAGGLLALKSNPGRAAMANAPDMFGGVSSLAQVTSPYMSAGSSLFQRTTDSSKLDVPLLSQTVFQKAAAMFGPESAQALALQVEDVMTGGNEMAKRQMVGVLGQQFPEIFEPHKDGLMSVVDNRIQDPMEKELHMRSAVELENPVDRARVMGALFDGGKYTPLDNTPRQPAQIPTMATDIDMVMNSLNGAFEANNSFGDATSMTNEMKLNQLIHAQDF